MAAIQESKLTGLLFFFHNQVSFTRKPLSTKSKNDLHLEELTTSIAMDNTEFLITNVYFTPASSCNGHYSPSLYHLLTGTDSLMLGDFNAPPFTLAIRDNRYQRQSTGGFNQYFQLCRPKYRFTHKTPWECRPQFSRCIISISLSHHLVRMAHTQP